MMTHQRFSFVVAALAIASGCGSDVEHAASSTTGAGGDGAGGAGQGGSGAAGAGGGSGGAGGGVACGGALSIKPPTIAITALFQTTPRIAVGPGAGHVLYAFLNDPSGAASSMYAMDVEPFGAWPPVWSASQMVDSDVKAYALGRGPSGPVGLIHYANKPPSLVDALLPALSVVNAPMTDGGAPLFVTAIPDRYLWAGSQATGAYHVLNVGSYEPNSLPQSEDPLLCTTTPHFGQAVPSGKGFVAAFVEPNQPAPACDPMAPKPGTVVALSRYEVPAGVGTFLQRTEGDRFTTGEPLVSLGLAPASFGAWVVFQTDGSTSFAPPPIVASRVDASGHALVQGGDMVQVTQGGFIAPALSVAALGDTLAVAFVDNTDIAAPSIRVHIVHADGKLGPQAVIQTSEVWDKGSLQIVASEAQDSLFLVWSASAKGGIPSFTRVDCLL